MRITDYDTKKWEHTYKPKKGNGYVVTEHERLREAQASKNEIEDYQKELRMNKVLADNGYRVQHLKGIGREQGQTYDILLNDMKADLKSTQGHGNIVKYAKKATTKQGAEAIVFELPKASPQITQALHEAKQKYKCKVFYYFDTDKVVQEI